MGEFARRPPEIPGLLEEETPNGRLAHVLDDTISRILDKRIRAGRRMASSRARAVRVVGG
jgi:hypothetical protein